jgi:hypothetical protein
MEDAIIEARANQVNDLDIVSVYNLAEDVIRLQAARAPIDPKLKQTIKEFYSIRAGTPQGRKQLTEACIKIIHSWVEPLAAEL